MKKKLFNLFNRRVLSPWWIFSIDWLLASLAFVVAYVVRLNFKIPTISLLDFLITGGISVGVYAMSFLFFNSYKGVIRHTELRELIRLIYTNFSSVVILFALDLLNQSFNLGVIHIPYLVLVLQFVFTLFFLTGFRMLVRELYAYLSRFERTKKTLIYGAGDLGLLALEILNKERKENYEVVGFVDDDKNKWSTHLRDIQVSGFPKAMSSGMKKGVTMVVLAISKMRKEKISEITEICLENNWEVKVLPDFDDWIDGKMPTKSVRDVKIEDLLGRDEIKLNLEIISQSLVGKTILVSGAAGSIGSEIVRQLLRFPIGKLILLDQAESALYDLQQEIVSKYDKASFESIVGDISNQDRMRKVFEQYKPQIVFNAAAYKHVPLMEGNPYEAINVNVRGTRNLADLSVEFNIEKFVMISTDKAVNPTNVMGASKRMCEIYIQALSQRGNINTAFITTRFGNVLGSNGSVVPLFKKQIEQGGPVKVTHPDITRYFMTIPEACQLVLEAGCMGQGGEIFVFDMGKPIKILDLAKKMVQLAGLKLNVDINITFTGLRPGEKLYEELLARSEDTLPTHNKKIMIGQVRHHDYEDVNTAISQILDYLNIEDNDKLVARMKDLVPEFISKNSVYELLDERGKKTDTELLMFDNDSIESKEKESISIKAELDVSNKSVIDLSKIKEMNPKLKKKSILSLRKQKLIDSSYI
ncbi:nucleoside-diphosphate sugar epimerase/dehydratase [Ancylomarina sp. 16SWW S1-10-2]|uniref:polysaccharide biosynthesis protein n=1 Tax=Ancylomarina sp. 16SWW S1-10-2 TaxID=2499681 RepID=UPI0012AE3DF6|nr:nucleoside-diphosphate sugar epimerase/dehydratase [Ancylomarina sp. 16SWW S1-10-2]MRT93447.1 polysaccharide biosynthesis protein [Ancylomarina sp. 16SWW S1-10-2]